MNKNIAVLMVILAVAGVVLIGYVLVSSKQESSTPVKQEIALENKTNSRYIEYSKEKFEQAINTKRVIFFYANWCPTCRPADAGFEANSDKIPDGVTIIRVNYNDTDTDQEEKDLAQKYQIAYQHTFVQINSKGDVVTRWNGGQIKELLTNIK